MNLLLFSGLELAYEYFRNFVAIRMITYMTGADEDCKAFRQIMCILPALMTFISFVLGRIHVQSCWILLITVLFSACLAGYSSSGGLMLRITASVLSFFLVTAISIFLGGVMILFSQDPDGLRYDLAVFYIPGSFALLHRLLSAAASVLLFFSLRSYYPCLRLLEKGRLLLVLGISGASYTLLFLLQSLLSADSLLSLQRAVILLGLLLLLLAALCFLLIAWSAQYRHTADEQGLWNYTNRLLADNYHRLSSNQKAIAKQVHDFTNHLLTLQELLSDDTPLAKEYIRSLLDTASEQTASCQSGSEVIDAIINCKQAEARALSIQFTYIIHLPVSLSIPSVDLCAVLANLLDNAIEACQKLPDPKERFIHISIGYKYNFIFFRVENSVENNPLGTGRTPATTKKDRSRPHGLGLKNVLDTVRRYSGALEQECKEHRFSSVAMMQLPAEDVKKMEIAWERNPKEKKN